MPGRAAEFPRLFSRSAVIPRVPAGHPSPAVVSSARQREKRGLTPFHPDNLAETGPDPVFSPDNLPETGPDPVFVAVRDS